MYLRAYGSTASGGGFNGAVVRVVWQKATVVLGYDSAVFRKDSCGAWIKFSDYGTTGDHGWEVDHVQPVAKGGGDALSNLQPLHWKNNRHKGDSYPGWSCLVAAA